MIFINDLIQLILQWRHSGREVIICIDANDPVDNPKAKISQLFQEMDLTDLHQHKYPGSRKPAMQQCRSKAIDLIAGSPKVVKALIHTWICPLGKPAAIKGDHRLLGVNLDPGIIFSNVVAPLAKFVLRGVHSHHEQKVTKFCKCIITQCNHYQMAQHLGLLQSLPTLGPEHLAKLESINKQLTKILINADCHCQPTNADPWSLELNQAYLCHRLWMLALSTHSNDRDMYDVLKLIQKQLLPTPDNKAALHRSPSANL